MLTRVEREETRAAMDAGESIIPEQETRYQPNPDLPAVFPETPEEADEAIRTGVQQGENPWYEDLGRGVIYGGLEGLINTGDSLLDLGNMIEAGLDIDETDAEIVGNKGMREYLGLEEDAYSIDSLDTTGQIAAAITQFGVGMIPATRVIRGANLAGRVATNLSRMISKYTPGSNAVDMGSGASRFGRLAMSEGTKKFLKKTAETGATGALAEQFAFDPDDPRLADALYETDIPFLADAADMLRAKETDTETIKRVKMAMEGMGIGLVIDTAGGVATRVFGRFYKPKVSASDKEAIVQATGKAQVSLDEAVKSAAEKFSVEDFEKLKTLLEEATPTRNFGRVVDFLREKGQYEGTEMEKYFGSINANKLVLGGLEPYNLIRETAELMAEKAKAAGEDFPPKKSWTETFSDADANLLGAENVDQLKEALEGTATSPLVLHGEMTGIELSADLSNLTTYVVAARQTLADSASYVMATARTARGIKGNVGEASEEYIEAKGAYAQALFAHRALQETVNNISNESGRLLNSFNMPISGAGKARYLKDLLAEGGEDLDKLIEASAVDNLTAANFDKMMREKMGKVENRVNKAIGEYWYNSILSATDTAAINFMGSVGVQANRIFLEGGMAALSGGLRRLAGAAPEETSSFSDLASGIRGMTTAKTDYNPNAVVLEEVAGAQLIEGRVMEHIAAGKYGASTFQEAEEILKRKGKADPRKHMREMAKKELESELMAGYSNAFKTAILAFQALMEKPQARARFAERNQSEFVQQGGAQAIASQGKVYSPAGNFIGKVVRFPTNVMAGTDVLFKSISQNRYLYEEAHRLMRGLRDDFKKTGEVRELIDADGKKIKISAADFMPPDIDPATGRLSARSVNYGALVERLVANPPVEILERANKKMLEDVFQQDTFLTKATLHARKLGDTVGKAPGYLLKQAGVPPEIADFVQVPLGTMLIPFVKTPINIAMYAIDRTPLVGMLTASNRELMREGGASIDQLVARQSVGLAFLGLGQYAAQEGYITGGLPSDPVIRQNLTQSGWQPYSVYYDGKYYPYSRMDPFAMFAGFSAMVQTATKQVFESGELSTTEKRDLLMVADLLSRRIGEGAMVMIGDKTYLQNLGELMGGYFNPKSSLPNTLAGVAGNAVGGMIPSILSRAGESFELTTFYDPVLRDTYVDVDFFEKFLYHATAKLPGVREKIGLKLFPSVDQFGEHRIRGKGFPFQALPLTRVTPEKDTAEMSRELYRLGERAKFVDDDFTIPGSEQKIKLTKEWYYYRSRVEGAEYARLLRNAMDTETYQNSSDKVRRDFIKKAKKAAQNHALHKLYEKPVIDAILNSTGRTDLIKDAQRQDVYDSQEKVRNNYINIIEQFNRDGLQ